MRYYKISSRFWKCHLYFLAELLMHIGERRTGIEIHPAAKIGRNFFCDHGGGVIVGETSIIGDNVTIYQGVTLGGVSTSKGKRHPTLENDVLVGAGAKILGPVTIGQGAKIGANEVVRVNVPPFATYVNGEIHEKNKGAKK
jgi:serine O-acetyltransferase